MPLIEYPGLDEPVPPILQLPHPQCEVTERYDLIDIGWAQGVALFRVVHRPPASWQTPEQVRASREETEGYYFSLSVHRHVARAAADELGFPARCKRPACRRARACKGNRHEFDWSFPGPWMVPCAATIRQIDEVRALVREAMADPVQNQERTGAEGDALSG